MISGAAYTNNQPESGALRSCTHWICSPISWMIQNPPNTGDQNPVGPTGVDFSNANGFDIPAGVDRRVYPAPAMRC